MNNNVAKVMEITSQSPENFEHAIRLGIERAGQTVDQLQSAWVKEQKILIKDNRVEGFQVNMKVTFILRD